jgi:hypothetical protein
MRTRFLFLGLCLLAAAGVTTTISSPRVAPQATAVAINEYLADPPDGPSGDANGDGSRDSAEDEFVEIVNTGTEPLDVGGFTISDAAQVRFTIPPGKIIPSGEAAVIFGGGAPVGEFGNAGANGLVFSAGGAGLSLNNGGDSIIIRDSFGVEMDRRNYPSSDGSANQSMTRSPDVTGDFVPHSTASGSEGRLFSPGALANGRPFVTDDPAITSISPVSAVRGTGDVTITVAGSRFQNGARVRIDGEAVATTFIGEGELQATLPTSITSVAGTRAVTVENPDRAVSNGVAFTVLGAAGVNEFLADPPDGPSGDANGDGSRDSAEDEFIEIVNRTDGPLDIEGFTLSDADQLRFTFPAGAVIPASEAALVFGGGSPPGEFGNASVNGLVFTAPLSLNNGGDTITLRDAAGALVERIAYGPGEGGANQSLTRNPDISGTAFALHSTLVASNGALFSPGALIDGSPFSRGPRISGIDPDRAPLSRGPLDLRATGSGFDGESILFVDGSPVATEIESEIELAAVVPPSVTSTPGIHPVEVRNRGGNRSNIVSLIIVPPPPLLFAVLPRTVQAGAGGFDLFLQGEGFDPGAAALIEGQEVRTTFINSRELAAKAPASFARTEGARRVRVRNGDGQQSNERSFDVALPLARISSMTPAQAIAESSGLMLTISGANLRSGATVLFDQTPLETSFISESSLLAEVPPSLLINPGLKAVVVRNEDGAISNDAIFRVLPVAPLIHSIDPPSVLEGSGHLMIAISGERFKPGARVRIPGPPGPGPELETLFVNSARIEAKLPDVFIRSAGRVFLRVENPDFGISNAAALDVFIRDPIVINEFLANPADDATGDANGDGVRSSSQDEFVEIVNRSAEPADLSGFRLMDSEAVRHIFAAGTVIPPFEAVVVFGGGNPRGRFGNAAENNLLVKASTGGLSLNNGGDRLRLEDAEGRAVQEIEFDAAEGSARQSINREPDRDGRSFALHSKLSKNGLLFSPGADVNGGPFTVKPAVAALSPASARAGSATLSVTISGSDFLPGAEALFDEMPLPTIVRSDKELEANLSAELLAEGGAALVRVRNPKGQVSEGARFLIVEAAPRIASINPQQTGTGAGKLDMALTGERFQRGATATVAGEPVETAFINRGLLRATVPDRFFERAAVLEVRVTNADEMHSNSIMLVIDNGPLITRLSPETIKAGGGAAEIKIGGLSFKRGVALFVNDIPVSTSFVSDTSIAARIIPEMTASAGTLTLQARNRDGGRSNKATIRIVE